MGLLNETMYFIALAFAIILLEKGSTVLFKVLMGHLPVPAGLREALAA